MEIQDKRVVELEKWTRLDARRRDPVKGKSPDVDEDAPPATRQRLLDEAGHLATIEGDFWKRSEFLKCMLGVPMWTDERGLPSGYQAGPGVYRSQTKRRL